MNYHIGVEYRLDTFDRMNYLISIYVRVVTAESPGSTECMNDKYSTFIPPVTGLVCKSGLYSTSYSVSRSDAAAGPSGGENDVRRSTGSVFCKPGNHGKREGRELISECRPALAYSLLQGVHVREESQESTYIARFELIIFRNGHGATEHLVRWEAGRTREGRKETEITSATGATRRKAKQERRASKKHDIARRGVCGANPCLGRVWEGGKQRMGSE